MELATDSYAPWPIVLCSIDPGAEWGADIRIRGKRYNEYEGPKHDVVKVVHIAYKLAERENLPLVFVIESHTDHGAWNFKGQAGLAENTGVWKYAINGLPRRKPTTKIVRIQVNEWRRKIFGRSRKPSWTDERGRDYWKARAVETVRDLYGVAVGHNAAEAMLLGEYACKSYRVGGLPGMRKGTK